MNRIILINPKYPHNVGGVLRAAAIFGGIDNILWTGNRFDVDSMKRLPREERIKDYSHIKLTPTQLPLSYCHGMIPVCVEIREQSESLYDFIHPENAVYIFGPEDGSIGKAILPLCHRFVHIPGNHCMNLASAVNVILYDRNIKNETL